MASMTPLSAHRRPAWSRAIAILLLAGLASLAAAPWLLREWHAWRGYQLFVERKFPEASRHFARAEGGATLVAAYHGLPSIAHLYAQSLLVAGRRSEAVAHYSGLADLDPQDATPAFIIALHDGTRGNWESATARLERHKASSRCQPCKAAHARFQAAAVAVPKIARARREQEAHLAGMKLPALCLGYRAGSAAASALAGELLGFIEPGVVSYLQASGLTKKAAEWMASSALSGSHRALEKLVEGVAPRTMGLEVGCARSVRLHEILHLEGIGDIVSPEALEGLLERLPYAGPYVRGAKDVLEAGVHLRELTVLTVAYATAYKAESDARGPMAEAGAYAEAQWDAVRNAARTPAFARGGVARLEEGSAPAPGGKSWLETIKSYLWPL